MYMQNMHVYVHYIIYIVVEVSMTSLLEHSDVQPKECKFLLSCFIWSNYVLSLVFLLINNLTNGLRLHQFLGDFRDLFASVVLVPKH